MPKYVFQATATIIVYAETEAEAVQRMKHAQAGCKAESVRIDVLNFWRDERAEQVARVTPAERKALISDLLNKYRRDERAERKALISDLLNKYRNT